MAPRTETRLGVCNLCEAICGLQLTLTDGRVTGVRGNPDDPLSRGHICPKGVAIADVHDDPDRLRRPVRRVVDRRPARRLAARSAGTRRSTWPPTASPRRSTRTAGDALGDLPRQPQRAQPRLADARHGDGQVASAPATSSAPPRSTSCRTSWSRYLMFGHQLLLPIPDLDRTSYFLVFGGNPMASNGSLMTVPDFPNRLRALKARGGRMVVVDPRRTETAKVADEHLFVRPGTDAFVLLAMLHVLFDEGLATPARRTSTGWTTVRAAVADFTPERAEAAQRHRRRRRPPPGARVRRPPSRRAAYGRVGVSTQEFGSVCHVGGQPAQRRSPATSTATGGAMFTRPAVDAVGRRADRPRPPRRVAEPGPRAARVRRRAAGRGAARGDRDAGRRARSGRCSRWPATRCSPRPTAPRLDEALAGLDFMVAVDIYVNETTRHADVILPPTDGARARPLRPGLPRARGAQHRPVHAGGAPEGGGRPARLGDLPRDRAAHRRPAGRRSRPLKKRLLERARLRRQPDRD